MPQSGLRVYRAGQCFQFETRYRKLEITATRRICKILGQRQRLRKVYGNTKSIKSRFPRTLSTLSSRPPPKYSRPACCLYQTHRLKNTSWSSRKEDLCFCPSDRKKPFSHSAHSKFNSIFPVQPAACDLHNQISQKPKYSKSCNFEESCDEKRCDIIIKKNQGKSVPSLMTFAVMPRFCGLIRK